MWPTERVVFLVLHLATAAAGAVACGLLAVAEGHPPGLIFVPVALAVWLVIHAALFGVRRLLRHSARPDPDGGSGWPAPLVLLGLVAATILLAQSWYLVPGLLGREGRDPRAWLIALAMLAPAGLVVGGLVHGARSGAPIARWVVAAGPVGYAAFVVVESIRRFVVKGRLDDPPLTLVVVTAICASIGVYVCRSSAVTAFLAARARRRASRVR